MFSLMYNMVFWLPLLIITIDLLPVSCCQINTDVCCDACATDEISLSFTLDIFENKIDLKT